MSKQKFIKDVAGLVIKYPSPVFNSVRIAQACLESDYGRSELATKAHNYFGIKTSSPWTGDRYDKPSYEYINGIKKLITSPFRKYGSLEQSVKDHASFFGSTEYRKNYYRNVIHAKTIRDQVNALQGTYATDINYAEKLMRLINEHNLQQYDKENATMKLTAQQAFQKLGLKYTAELLDKVSRKHFVGTTNKKLGIVVHQTGAPNAGANARAMANYQRNMASPNNHEEKSWHYQVDDKEVIQSFSHNACTWQASDGWGLGNTGHISIEKCINSDGDYNKAFDNLAKLCAVICYIEGFNPYKDIKRHYDFARDKKWCPAQIMNGKNGLTFKVLLDRVNKYLGQLKGAEVGHNPQGLQATKTTTYKAPELPFKTLKKGDTVTLSKGFLWFDPVKQELLLSKRQKELELTKDKIAEVKDIPDVNNSRYAYRLEKYNSWILEEYLVEPKSDWKLVKEEDKSDSKESVKLKDGQFYWNGKLFEVKEVK